MFIDSITLNNFRAYKGQNTTTFSKNGKNVFVIAGNNGFGKTTYLTSLVWCLYGKLMGDVDEKFRRDINDAQGYKGFAKSSLNKECAAIISSMELTLEDKKAIAKNGYYGTYEAIKDISQYYVEMHITDIFIPSIPCSQVSIRRTYDYLLESESVEVLIDGHVNELAKEVGYDIFINDFILSKEIAKFFLFDAEKIVNLAEVRSLEEKRKLSTAYSEVLGIKKYEDIRRSLENLRIKFRKKTGSSAAQNKLTRLTDEAAHLEEQTQLKEARLVEVNSLIETLSVERESLQEQLIREGNALSVDELDKLRSLLAELKKKDVTLKNHFREMLDIAPFAISGSLFCETHKQVDIEYQQRTKLSNTETLIKAMLKAKMSILKGMTDASISNSQQNTFEGIINLAFENTLNEFAPSSDSIDNKTLLDYSVEENNAFNALFDNIRYSFNISFRQLVKDIKNNNIFLQKTQRKLAIAENTDDNAFISGIRDRKFEVDTQLTSLKNEVQTLSTEIAILNRDYTTCKKQISECMKLIRVDAMDKDKDTIAERLISELTVFLTKLRETRKFSLEQKIKNEIGILMHKTDFISDVSIDLAEDIIEINLLDQKNEIINKEKLSKGEQQLYATSILKALVDESGISFPVFIDSPLQKFDSIHSKNIITKFYPNVAKQVVIFPLLGKELSEAEYRDLLPNVNNAYIIQNESGASSFKAVSPDKIFEELR